MAQKDEVAFVITDEDLKKVLDAYDVVDAILGPRLKSLNGHDRQGMAKMGDKTFAFVKKSYEYCKIHKELTPNYLSVEALKKDLDAVDILRTLSARIAPLFAAIEDTLLLSGSEAYQAALSFYGNVKAAAKAKAPNAIAVYEDLSARFPGAPTKKKTGK